MIPRKKCNIESTDYLQKQNAQFSQIHETTYFQHDQRLSLSLLNRTQAQLFLPFTSKHNYRTVLQVLVSLAWYKYQLLRRKREAKKILKFYELIVFCYPICSKMRKSLSSPNNYQYSV